MMSLSSDITTRLEGGLCIDDGSCTLAFTGSLRQGWKKLKVYARVRVRVRVKVRVGVRVSDSQNS